MIHDKLLSYLRVVSGNKNEIKIKVYMSLFESNFSLPLFLPKKLRPLEFLTNSIEKGLIEQVITLPQFFLL